MGSTTYIQNLSLLKFIVAIFYNKYLNRHENMGIYWHIICCTACQHCDIILKAFSLSE